MARNEDIIPDLLERWHDTKKQIAVLESECEKYKRASGKIMNQRGEDHLHTDYYTVKRRDVTKASLTKSCVPKEIWDKYARDSSYQAYYLTENK